MLKTLPVVSVLLLTCPAIEAADFTWTGGGSNRNWATAENWSGTPAFTSSNDFYFYSSPTGTRLNSPSFLGGSRTIRTLIYTGSTSVDTGIRLTSSAGGTGYAALILSGITVQSGSSGNHTIGVDGYGTVRIGSAVTTARIDHNGSGVLTIVSSVSENNGAGSSLEKTGSGRLVLRGENTYTGNTLVNGGTIDFADTSETRFVLGDGGYSNSILGTGSVNFSGMFRLDASGLTDELGSWNLVNTATLTSTFEEGSFGLAFTDGTVFSYAGSGIYTSGKWAFDVNTGNLSAVPEPSEVALFLGGALTAFVAVRRLRARRA